MSGDRWGHVMTSRPTNNNTHLHPVEEVEHLLEGPPLPGQLPAEGARGGGAASTAVGVRGQRSCEPVDGAVRQEVGRRGFLEEGAFRQRALEGARG